MSVTLAIFVVISFAALLHVFRLPAYAREVGRRGRDCWTTVQDASMPDREKEEALQHHARRLFVLLGILGGGSLLALGVPLGFVWVLDHGNVASFDRVIQTLERIDFLVGTIIGGALVYAVFQYVR